MSSRTWSLMAAFFALPVLCLSAFGEPVPPAATDSVFLVGDAGKRGAKDQVLAALREDVAAASATLGKGHVTVIFLGDNVYEKGLLAKSGTICFRWALARLVAQVKSANVNPGVAVYFVPGNHDWDHQGKRGLARIKRQTEELAKLGGNVAMLPGYGCPGPSVRTAGARLQILFLDTQWWLHEFERPAAGECPQGTETEVTAAIEKHLANAGGRLSILAAHHPLISGGSHGRGRRPNTSEQDQDNDDNLHMRTEIIQALAASPPVAWVSGHEHTLEVLKDGGAPFLLVSGAGNFNHTDNTIPDKARGNWLFPPEAGKLSGGYMRLDVPAVGAPWVHVITVDKNRAPHNIFSTELDSP